MFNAYNTLFQGTVSSALPLTERFCSSLPSRASRNVYAWMAQIPRMREWVGDRLINNIGAFSYELPNKTYEATIGVEREKIEDDEYGVFNLRVSELARVSNLLMDDLTIAAMRAGHSAGSETYDGVPFFSASHPVDPQQPGFGSNQSNYSSSGLALTATNYQTARATMMAYKGQDGFELNVMPDLLVVPPQLERTALTIINADFIPSDAGAGFSTSPAQAPMTNILKGSAKVLVLPRLSADATTWYLLDTSRAIKPFIQQWRRKPSFTMLTDPQAFSVFMQRTFLMGVDARAAAGYGLWHFAYKAVA